MLFRSTKERYYDNLFKQLILLTNLGKKVIIMGGAPIVNGYDINCMAKSISFPWVNCKSSFPIDENVVKVNRKLQKIAASHHNIEFYLANDYLCDKDVCYSEDKNNQPLFFNKSHLSHDGSKNIGKAIIKNEGVPLPFKNMKKERLTH